MKSVYPEVISLRYANIPKTAIEGQCSGVQLIVDMSLSDNAAETASVSKQTQSTVNRISSTSSAASEAVPSSTQAVFKAGSIALAGQGSHEAQSVCKAGGSDSAQVNCEVPQSPSEPLRMMAVKAEFERRLEKQVSPACLLAAVYMPTYSAPWWQFLRCV